MSVTEISHQVGYSSVGTFSTRFSSSVGVSPRTYRQLNGVAPHVATANLRTAPDQPSATVEGLVSHNRETGYVFVGILPDPFPQGRPISCAVLPGPGPYTLNNVAPGKWYVLPHRAPAGDADCVNTRDADCADTRDAAWATNRADQRTAASIGTQGLVLVRPDTVLRVDLRLRPMRSFDPPALLALLDGRSLVILAD